MSSRPYVPPVVCVVDIDLSAPVATSVTFRFTIDEAWDSETVHDFSTSYRTNLWEEE